MHCSWIGIATLLFVASASAVSTPSPSSAELKCNDSAVPPKILTECLEMAGYSEGNLRMRECICDSLGLDKESCKIKCSGLSPSMREAPSIYSTGMVTGDRNVEGDPNIDTVIVVANNRPTLPNAAAANVIGKDSVDIPRLSGTQKQHGQHRQRRRRRKTSSAAKQKPGMSTMKKIVGGIALGVLVMVV